MADLAGTITLDRERQTLLVDGVEFPWYVAERGPSVEAFAARPDDVFTVWVPILCERLLIADDLPVDLPTITHEGPSRVAVRTPHREKPPRRGVVATEREKIAAWLEALDAGPAMYDASEIAGLIRSRAHWEC